MALSRERNRTRNGLLLAAFIAVFAAIGGCATTGGSGGGGYGPPPIPEGKGRVMLEAGGINEVNYYVLDEATGEEVHSESWLRFATRLYCWWPWRESRQQQRRFVVE